MGIGSLRTTAAQQEVSSASRWKRMGGTWELTRQALKEMYRATGTNERVAETIEEPKRHCTEKHNTEKEV